MAGVQNGHTNQHQGTPAPAVQAMYDQGRSNEIHHGAQQAQANIQRPTPQRTSGGVDFLTGQRDKKAFKKADNHTSTVRVLRWLFPIVGFLIVLSVSLTYFWHQAGSPTLQVESKSFDSGNMIMQNPVLRGLDKESRPYELTAKQAIQDASNLNQIELSEIKASVPMDENTNVDIRAGNGFYDAEAKKLNLGGNVDLTTQDGMNIQLQDAKIDIGKGHIITENFVQMNSASAKISSNGVEVKGNGEHIIFKSNVKMTIYPQAYKDAQNSAKQ